jgi:hypothetical protein
MPVDKVQYESIREVLAARNAILVAVSKTKPIEDIQALYNLGQRDFGENYMQELADKVPMLPRDIRWHFIGYLQSNKVKHIVQFASMIHGIDRLTLLRAIEKESAKCKITMDCLLQVHIAQEESKFGMNEQELQEVMQSLALFPHVRVKGLMGMASFTKNTEQIRNEFALLKYLFDKYKGVQDPDMPWTVLSMGMSGDYRLALEEGSTMVRIGSLLFGARR